MLPGSQELNRQVIGVGLKVPVSREDCQLPIRRRRTDQEICVRALYSDCAAGAVETRSLDVISFIQRQIRKRVQIVA